MTYSHCSFEVDGKRYAPRHPIRIKYTRNMAMKGVGAHPLRSFPNSFHLKTARTRHKKRATWEIVGLNKAENANRYRLPVPRLSKVTLLVRAFMRDS